MNAHEALLIMAASQSAAQLGVIRDLALQQVGWMTAADRDALIQAEKVCGQLVERVRAGN